jgi:FkbM family methyltransferase
MNLRSKKEFLDHLRSANFEAEAIIDVGAANGTVGLYETFPSAHYVLIDILDKFNDGLTDIVKSLASCEHLIAAVGSSPGNVRFYYDPKEDHKVTFADFQPDGWVESTIKRITIDDIVFTNPKLQKANNIIIKIDVDGPELDVLAGCSESFNKNCVFIIEAPLLDRLHGRFTEISAFMHLNGFELYDLLEPVYRPSDEALWQVDAVYVPTSSPLRTNHSYAI